jgi:ketosteroid isomerase-like protein
MTRSILRRCVVANVLAASAICFATGANAQGAPPKQAVAIELPAEFASVLRNYEKAWRGRDMDALSRLFVDGATVLTNTGNVVVGRGAVRDVYAGSGGALFLRAYAFADGGEVAHIIGGYALSANGPDVGTYVLALVRPSRTGPWLIAADLDRAKR